jgi:ParB family chromosome partitioning protein
MMSELKKPVLAAYSDIFKPTDQTAADTAEKVVILPISSIRPHPDNPYNVVDDEEMFELAATIKTHGILTPIIVRPLSDGLYQSLAGHRRVRGSELAGIDTIKAMIMDVDDDEADIIMSVTNKQRENALPSERARSYQRHYHALMRKQGTRTDLTDEESGNTRSVVARAMGVSETTLDRYMKLTALTSDLMNMVDTKVITIAVGYLLADLSPKEQALLFDFVTENKVAVKEPHAVKLKAEKGSLTESGIGKILRYRKPKIVQAVKIPYKRIKGFFAADIPPKEIEDLIFTLLSEHFQKQDNA